MLHVFAEYQLDTETQRQLEVELLSFEVTIERKLFALAGFSKRDFQYPRTLLTAASSMHLWY